MDFVGNSPSPFRDLKRTAFGYCLLSGHFEMDGKSSAVSEILSGKVGLNMKSFVSH
jgi:hypothetical protein